MSPTVSNRPLVATARAAAPVVKAKQAAPAPNQGVSALKVAQDTLAPGNLVVLGRAAQAGSLAFTPPLIVDIVKSSVRSVLTPMNVAWFAVPAAINNVRDLMNGKISAGRAAGNVTTTTTLGLAKNAAAFVGVQSLSVAIGPVLGSLPISATLLPFVGIGVSLAGLVGTYWLANKLIKKTGLDTKMSDAITNLLGGDKPAPAPAAAKA